MWFVLRLTLLLLGLVVLLLISGIKSNLCCWGFFDFLNAQVFAIPGEKPPNLLSAGREPNTTCSNQDLPQFIVGEPAKLDFADFCPLVSDAGPKD